MRLKLMRGLPVDLLLCSKHKAYCERNEVAAVALEAIEIFLMP